MERRDKRIIAVALISIIVLVGILSVIYPGYLANGGNGGCPYYTTPPSKPVLNQPTSPDTDGVIHLDWSDSARICHYNIYRKHQSEISYTKIASGIGGYESSNPSSYTDTVMDNGLY